MTQCSSCGGFCGCVCQRAKIPVYRTEIDMTKEQLLQMARETMTLQAAQGVAA